MAYNLLDLISSVQDDLHDPSFSSTRITRYLNYGQLKIFNTHMFKFCEQSVRGALTVGSYAYAQQTDHQETIGGALVDPVTTTNRFILDETTYTSHRQFFDQYPDPSLETTAQPVTWTEFGTLIYFNCPVDKAYNFTQRYYRRPTTMTASTDVPTVPEGFRELLEVYADHRSEKYRGNHDIAATYLQDFEDGLEDMNLRFAGRTRVASAKMSGFRTRVND